MPLSTWEIDLTLEVLLYTRMNLRYDTNETSFYALQYIPANEDQDRYRLSSGEKWPLSNLLSRWMRKRTSLSKPDLCGAGKRRSESKVRQSERPLSRQGKESHSEKEVLRKRSRTNEFLSEQAFSSFARTKVPTKAKRSDQIEEEK